MSETPSALYYEQTSQLKKPGTAQPRIVVIKGLFRPDLQDGIELSSTADSDRYRRTMVDEGELREALGGKMEFDQGPSLTKYHRIGQIQINQATPQSIRDLTAMRIVELMGMLQSGEASKREAEMAIYYMFDDAARIVTAQNTSASGKAPQASTER
ncbi:MAG: hypothetical protein NTX63_05370 [Candidatus Peregrinibacteria bacterium]|nr:hypothetical protein [Candidatus Peregrinibacteria bacterium]